MAGSSQNEAVASPLHPHLLLLAQPGRGMVQTAHRPAAPPRNLHQCRCSHRGHCSVSRALEPRPQTLRYGTRPPTTPSPRSTETKPPSPTKPNPRHTTSWMGLQTRLPEQRRETSNTHRIHRHIQSDPTPQRTRRTITHDRPRQPPLWEGHLVLAVRQGAPGCRFDLQWYSQFDDPLHDLGRELRDTAVFVLRDLEHELVVDLQEHLRA